MKKPYATMRVASVTDKHLHQPGTFVNSKQKPHFSQRTREMGHPAPGTRHPASTEEEKLLDDCRILVRTFDYVVKGRATAPPQRRYEKKTWPIPGRKIMHKK